MATYIAGVEVVTRVAAVARGALHKVGFHPTGVAARFGCALTAGRLLGLKEQKLAHTQGIAVDGLGQGVVACLLASRIRSAHPTCSTSACSYCCSQ